MMLEVVTRHLPGRPTYLRANMYSVRAMGETVRQTILPDDVGRGVGWANTQMREFDPVGDYVWMLDDDDMATCPNLSECVEQLAARFDPDLIMLRMDHGFPFGVLPSRDDFGQRLPDEGGIGVSAFITKRAHWLRNRACWGDRYAGDYDFIKRAFETADVICWHDCIASRCQHGQNNGAVE